MQCHLYLNIIYNHFSSILMGASPQTPELAALEERVCLNVVQINSCSSAEHLQAS